MSDLVGPIQIAFGDPRLPSRFWDKTRVLNDGCWEWVGSKIQKGYGQIWGTPLRRNQMMAHRFSFLLAGGTVTDEQVLDHLCERKACVNPAHLRPCSSRENTLRGGGASAIHARKTHCPNGHEYSGSNVKYNKAGWRQCKMCQRNRRLSGYKAPHQAGLVTNRADLLAELGKLRRFVLRVKTHPDELAQALAELDK